MNKVTITACNKQWQFRFDFYAMELIYGDSIEFKGELAWVAKLIYAGLASNCEAKEMAKDFTKEDVLDIVNELSLTDTGKAEFVKINDCFLASQAFKSIVEKGKEIEGEEKKRLIGIGSTPLHLERSA